MELWTVISCPLFTACLTCYALELHWSKEVTCTKGEEVKWSQKGSGGKSGSVTFTYFIFPSSVAQLVKASCL